MPKPRRTQGHEEPNVWIHYRNNLPRHLIGISRDLQSRVMESLAKQQGYASLRPGFGPFLSLIAQQGRPVSTIAAELSISKQACSQIANLAEQAGYVERKVHPRDRRSKIVQLTRKGQTLVDHGAALILGADENYTSLVGEAAYRDFTAALASLYEAVRRTSEALPEASGDALQTAGVLPLISEWIQRELMRTATSRGHAGLKMSHGQVLPLLGPGGGRIHEMARVQGVSRQAISAISQDLEALGYLRREPDPLDRRGVVLRLTERGTSMLADSVAGVDDLEVELARMIGASALARMQRVAEDLYQALRLEVEVFNGRTPVGVAAAGNGQVERTTGDGAIERLAQRLTQELGRGDAAQLAELLDTQAKRTTP